MKKSLLLIVALILTQSLVYAQEQAVADELKPLAFTLGKWEFTWHHLDARSRKFIDDGIAYSTVTLIHDGKTYADEFYKENPDGSVVQGTTFRGYDPASKKLKLMWMVAGTLSYSTATGTQEGDEIVFYFDEEIKDKYGQYRVKVTFYDIQKDSYQWKQDFVYKDGTVVEKTMFYEARRIK